MYKIVFYVVKKEWAVLRRAQHFLDVYIRCVHGSGNKNGASVDFNT